MERHRTRKIDDRTLKTGNASIVSSSWVWVVSIILVLFLIALVSFIYLSGFPFKQSVYGFLGQTKSKLYGEFLLNTFLNPWFYGVFGVVLILEQFIPAKQNQKTLASGVRHDFIWVLIKLFSHASILPLYLLFLLYIYDRHLNFLTVTAVADWPPIARIILALLVGDFVFWVTHIVRHKVQILWHFHAVHHSQKELNFLTEYRVHPVDDAFIYTIGFIPIFMFEHSFITIVAIVWIRHWHTRIYHSNIRSNFGILRYILVTPQSHRIHHSIEPEHRDKNYGLTFSIWDYLFGTQYKGYDEYPDTGIEEHLFPFEQGRSKWDTLGVLLEQLLYPFRAIARKP